MFNVPSFVECANGPQVEIGYLSFSTKLPGFQRNKGPGTAELHSASSPSSPPDYSSQPLFARTARITTAELATLLSDIIKFAMMIVKEGKGDCQVYSLPEPV